MQVIHVAGSKTPRVSSVNCEKWGKSYSHVTEIKECEGLHSHIRVFISFCIFVEGVDGWKAESRNGDQELLVYNAIRQDIGIATVDNQPMYFIAPGICSTRLFFFLFDYV